MHKSSKWLVRLFQVLLMQVLIMVTAPCSPLQADEDLLMELGRLIGSALRGEEPAPAVAIEFMENGAPGAVPGEDERKEYQLRLQAFSDAMQSWVVKVCELPDEQQVKLKEIFAAELTSYVGQFAKGKDPNRQSHGFPKTFPLVFTLNNGIAARFQADVKKSLLKSVLTPPQAELLEAAIKEREIYRTQAYAEFVVMLIDIELFLTADQRVALTKQVLNRVGGLQHPLYSFQAQSYYLPYESMSVVVSPASGKDILEPSQKKRLADLTGADPNSQHIVFQASSGMDEWYKQMNEISLKQREQYLRATAVRVSWYEKELHLTSEQVEHLTNAGKGAAIRALGDWKETTQQTFEQMEQQIAQMGQNFGFAASVIDTKSIDQNEIWKDAVKSVTAGAAQQQVEMRFQRVQGDKSAMAVGVLALLDEELWLSPEQRLPLLAQFEKTMPNNLTSVQYQEYIRDIVLIAHPLFKTTEKKRDEILTEPQRDVWKQLASFFQWQKENNYVQIQLRNNGGSFGFTLGQ